MRIILASSSSYRKTLLQKIISEFETYSPNINESRKPDESFIDLSKRLAIEKAKALAVQFPDALIIGSDQVACINTTQLNKPLTRENTFNQLQKCQGQSVLFHTGICLYNSRTNNSQSSVESYQTQFRQLSDSQLMNYIDREPAFDCAGGFKMEGLGIALFEKIQGNDPNILIGLPLIKLISMLENESYSVLS